MERKKHVVLFSGGIESALVTIEVCRKFGTEDVILLNHNISPNVEDEDVKRFKQEVADYVGIEITYANHENWETTDPLDVCIDANAFKYGIGSDLCTNRLKTAPFKVWLKENFPSVKGEIRDDVIFYYGFPESERVRITRRLGIMASMGYMTDFPLAYWERTIQDIEEVGIEIPTTYQIFKHANCIGCLKAGRQHWYAVFILRPDIWYRAKKAEESIGHSIIKGVYLIDLEVKFKQMRDLKIEHGEKTKPQTYWANVRKILREETYTPPCDCAY